MLMMIITLTMALASAAIAGGTGAVPGDSIQGQSGAFIGDSSYNSSSIRFEDQRNITSAPVSFSVGSGYYSMHPITYNSGISSKTQIADTGSATSLRHEVDLAHGISGATEYAISSSSYHQYGPEYSGFSSTAIAHMKIDENVTDGKVHIGVLQGSDASGQGTNEDRTDPLINAWKNPSVEVDENYIGTYQIYKNISISSDYVQENRSESWLNCFCGGYFDINRRYPSGMDADKIFNYKSYRL